MPTHEKTMAKKKPDELLLLIVVIFLIFFSSVSMSLPTNLSRQGWRRKEFDYMLFYHQSMVLFSVVSSRGR